MLKGATASLYPGEAVALLGPSGAGKSTLLHIAGLLERPDGGAVVIDGVDCVKLGDAERTRMRRSEIGFVYQFHHLLPEFSALENVVLPQLILGPVAARGRGARRAIAVRRLASASGPTIARRSFPAASSSAWPSPAPSPTDRGCSSPTSRPAISIRHTAERVFEQLLSLVRQSGVAALVATHNLDLAARMDRVLRLMDGTLVEEQVTVVKVSQA